MKTTSHSFAPRLALCSLAAFGLLAFGGHARAQAILTFSGGNGTPLVLTLDQPVTYLINSGSGGARYFVFVGVGNPFGPNPFFMPQPASGSVSFSVNGGPGSPITEDDSGFGLVGFSPNDFSVAGIAFSVLNGDLVTLSAGTITTKSNIAGPPPANGSFTTFLTDFGGVPISANGTQVPEPATLAFIITGGAILAALARTRRLR